MQTAIQVRYKMPRAPLSIAEFSKRQVATIERQMLSATDLADLIDLSMTGIRQLSGGSQVEIWPHEPVDESDRHLDVIGVLSGTVRLVEDSYDFVSLYSEEPQWNRTASAVFNETSLFKSDSGVEQTLLLPVMDHDLLVGSVHIADFRSSVMMDDDQMTALRLRSQSAVTHQPSSGDGSHPRFRLARSRNQCSESCRFAQRFGA